MLSKPIFNDVVNVLTQQKYILNIISDENFVQKLSILNGSSIGEHTRHIIELFQCLISGYESKIINYEKRERNKITQEKRDFAIDCIDKILFGCRLENKPLTLESTIAGEPIKIQTQYDRELLYNIEHCIHHQAIIKIGMNELNIFKIEKNFGIASSTILYKELCAQ